MRCRSLIGWEVTLQTDVPAAFIVLLHRLHREKRGLFAISAIESQPKVFWLPCQLDVSGTCVFCQPYYAGICCVAGVDQNPHEWCSFLGLLFVWKGDQRFVYEESRL